MDISREKLLRDYAAGDIAWSTLRGLGFDNYLDVLGGLGELGLRPPVAGDDGPNAAALAGGLAIIRAALRARPGA